MCAPLGMDTVLVDLQAIKVTFTTFLPRRLETATARRWKLCLRAVNRSIRPTGITV